MVPPPSVKDDIDVVDVEAMRQELLRKLEALRIELLEGSVLPAYGQQSIARLNEHCRALPGLVQSLLDGIAELEQWHTKYRRYLSDEFRDEVSAHFHEAKRRALEEESSAHPQVAEER